MFSTISLTWRLLRSEGVPNFRARLVQMATQIQCSGAAAVLLTPNMMPLRDNGHVDPKYAGGLSEFTRRQTTGLLARYADAVREAGQASRTPVADVYAEWIRRSEAGEDMTAHLANGLNHPDAYGHQIAADLLFRVLLEKLS